MEDKTVLKAISQLGNDVNQIANNLNALSGKVDTFMENTNKRFDLLEMGQKELRHEVKALRIKEDILEIEMKQQFKDTKEELKEEIHKVDNRVAGLETIVGRYTNIVANKFDALEKDNSKDHEEFKEALKIAN